MLPVNLRRSGWQGAVLVAITYVYFLIFAQFAFIARLATLGIVDTSLKAVMAAMAVGGVVLSLSSPRVRIWSSPVARLRVSLLACAVAAFSSLLPLGLAGAILVALLIGSALGLLTVTLVTHLREWTGERHALYKVALGTGVAYLACNIPSFFTAPAEMQAIVAGLLCLAGVFVAPLLVGVAAESDSVTPSPLRFPLVVASFAALVWLDSAAFFIIQNTTALKASTWQGAAHLWANGLLHLGGAIASAFLLRRRGLSFVLSSAFLALGFACMLLLDPARALPASALYPVGVSLYSVALVAYPGLLSSAATAEQRGRQAGAIYAIAGWAGSALGIGMGQNLGYVPPAFVAAAGALVLLPVLIRTVRIRTREIALFAAVLFLAFVIYRIQPATPADASTPEHRGRLVYISEGCIHCHSQYVRPNTADVLMWGPVENLDVIHHQTPPLIGNRRQGPDLSQVGVRRSPLWLKAHLCDAREVSGKSIMPSYAFLLNDERGNDLVAYLASLRGRGETELRAAQQRWHLPSKALVDADPTEGRRLYAQFCATCHDSNGRTRIAWQSSFTESPAILTAGALQTSSSQDRADHFAHIIKFGIPNSDMAGHEYMPDHDIASLVQWLLQNSAQPVRND